jgi:hypothetical protein
MKTTKNQTAFLLLAFLFALISSCDPSCDSNKSCDELQADTIPNQLIIRFDSCANQIAIDSFIINEIPKYGKIKTRCMCKEELILIELHNNTILNLEAVHAKANEDLDPDGLGSAHFNFEIAIDSLPEDIKFADSKNCEANFNDTVVVAVIDGGIRQDSQLDSYLWKTQNFTTSSGCQSDPSLLNLISGSRSNHATIVSRFITQRLSTSKIELMDLRVFDKNNKGNLFDALCAINFALDNGADIINMSWGYYRNEFHPELLNLFQAANAQDVIIVASAGNDGKNTDICHHYPSGFDAQMFNSMLDNVISVAYLNNLETELACKSNFGPSSVSIAAPGYFSPTFQGSSYAAPSVTRMAAIIKGLHPEYKHKKIIDCIYDQASTTTPPLKVNTGGKLDEQMSTNCPPSP